MSRPEPRPALKRAEDGTVHPASPRPPAPRASAEQHLHPVPHAAATMAPASDARALPGDPSAQFTGKAVDLDVKVPKDLRRAVRRRAKREGRSVDELVAEVLATHLTGK